MIAPMRVRALVAAGLSAAACNPVAAPGLVLDVGRVCQDIALEVADPDLLPGWTIHAAAIPRSGEDAVWLLASEGPDELDLRRVPEDIPGLDLKSIGLVEEFDLKRGPVDGQVWLAMDLFGAARLWRIDEATATIAEGPPLLDFPAGEPSWTRRLVFVGQSPHLVAVPRSSTVGELPIQLAAITPSLELGERWTLTAKVECAPLSELNCPLLWDDLRDVALLDVAEANSIAGAAILLAITSPGGASPDPEMPPAFETHLLSVVIQRDPAAERPVLTRRDHVAWATDGPVQPWPAQLAADPLGLYVLAGLIPGPDSSGANATTVDYLFRADLLGGGSSGPGDVIALLPKDYRSHLLQLGSRVAIGQHPGGTWHVAPIEGITINEEIVGSLEVGDPVELLRAGRAQVVVTRDDGPSRRVQIACADPDPGGEDTASPPEGS